MLRAPRPQVESGTGGACLLQPGQPGQQLPDLQLEAWGCAAVPCLRAWASVSVWMWSTSRRAQELPGEASAVQVLMSDTVGFIQKLPTQLVAAFRATLEEIREAALILHVVDISHPNAAAQSQSVIEARPAWGSHARLQRWWGSPTP